MAKKKEAKKDAKKDTKKTAKKSGKTVTPAAIAALQKKVGAAPPPAISRGMQQQPVLQTNQPGPAAPQLARPPMPTQGAPAGVPGAPQVPQQQPGTCMRCGGRMIQVPGGGNICEKCGYGGR